MRHTDVAVVGGGLAGSAAAAMLGRAGHQAILIDPRPLYPNDFRCEKLDASQIRLLQQMGLADAVSRAATIDQRMWIARFCRVVEKRPSGQFDLSDRCTAGKMLFDKPRQHPHSWHSRAGGGAVHSINS